jgi:uncharacterized membrane protein
VNISNSILMRAPVERIFPLAAQVERWPELLPHYRWVTVLERDPDGRRKLVEMAARRGWIPVSWHAVQEIDSSTPAIRFHHVRGITIGMDVEWRFEPHPDGTLVSIHHALTPRLPFFAPLIQSFTHSIAGKTLARIKALAEENR